MEVAEKPHTNHLCKQCHDSGTFFRTFEIMVLNALLLFLSCGALFLLCRRKRDFIWHVYTFLGPCNRVKATPALNNRRANLNGQSLGKVFGYIFSKRVFKGVISKKNVLKSVKVDGSVVEDTIFTF